jgi:S1-C subfamily serine protease
MYLSNKLFVSRTFVALIALVALSSALSAAEREDEVTRAVAKAKDSAVAIVQLTANEDGSGVGNIIGGGAIIDRRGYILTNAHVVGDESAVGILLTDGTELVGYTVFTDKANDLAVLHVRRPGLLKLKEAVMASSSDLMLGERTIVIGSPRGKEHSVSFGRISSLSRRLDFAGGKVLEDTVQTDAAINPGNSGGPVFNINGEFIGTVVARTNNSTGLGYFIKSDTVDKVLSEKLGTASLNKTVHGITGTVKLLKKEGKDRQQLVVETVSGPAEAAGLKPKDVLLKVGEQNVRSRFDLERSLWQFKADDEVNLTVLREGKQHELKLKIAKWKLPKEVSKAVGSLSGGFIPFFMDVVPPEKK